MAGRVWFGTKQNMQWVEAPAVGIDSSRVGFAAKSQYLNGGAAVRRSQTAHKEYNMTWNQTSRENIRILTDYADGYYGNIIYWCDPFAMDVNVLPSYWACMSMSDGPILAGDARPELHDTVTNGLAYPLQSATYVLRDGEFKSRVYIPIPPNYTAWVGYHSDAASTGTAVMTVIPSSPAHFDLSPITLIPLPVTSTTRVSSAYSSADYAGISLSFAGVGNITVSGVVVQLLPIGYTPENGGFVSGQGSSGCAFEDQPQIVNYSAVLDKVGMTAKLVEVEQWQQ